MADGLRPLEHKPGEGKLALELADRRLGICQRASAGIGKRVGRVADMRDQLNVGEQHGGAVGRLQEGLLQGADVASGWQQQGDVGEL